MALSNDAFYVDGTFQPDKGKQAYFEMFDRVHYPVAERLKGDDMWIVDFDLGDFVRVGMGGILWWNDKEFGFFGHGIFLLPGQMIVEHAHVGIPGVEAKMEAWHVNYGMIYTFGEGEPTEPCPIELPASQKDFITVRHCTPVHLGEVVRLNRPTAKHFMVAGPDGAIVTEYGTYHDGAALRFTNPGVAF